MPNNVFVFPTFGRAITLDDQGIFYSINPKTGSIISVFQLMYEDEWYLYQLQNTARENEFCWDIMAERHHYALNSMTTEEIRRNFSKPEFAEPVGAWQVLRNTKYGFGKFTPLAENAATMYALIPFAGNEMGMPILIHRADQALLDSLEEMPALAVEFA